MTWQDVRGAIHVHSVHSDGSGSIQQIVDAALRARLDYLILTDHSSMEHREAGWEGWHPETRGRRRETADQKPEARDGKPETGGIGNGERVPGQARRDERVLLIIGGEASPWQQPHAVIIGLEDVHHLNEMSAAEYLSATKAEGGYSFLAHPRGKKALGMHLRAWTDWDNPHYTGIEVWSYMHDWIEEFSWLKLPSFYLNPHKRISGPHPDVLAAWDRVAAGRPCVGIAGTDAHAKPMFAGRLQVFPYEMLFGTTLTHALVEPLAGEDACDVQRVISALAAGRCYMAYHVLGDPAGFRFGAVSRRGETTMGGQISLSAGPVLEVSVPAESDIRLVVNGLEVRRGKGNELRFEPHAACLCRVEVRRDGKPWIFSNHIRVTA